MSIKTMLVIEMMGKPAEHVSKTMEGLLGKLSEEKGVEIISKEVHEPKKIETEKEEVFSCFCEIEIDVEEIIDLFRVVFTYMPSHIEIIQPDELRLKNFELSSIINAISQKLHGYDAVAKTLSVHKTILENKLKVYEEKSGTSVSTSTNMEVQDLEEEEPKKKKKKD